MEKIRRFFKLNKDKGCEESSRIICYPIRISKPFNSEEKCRRLSWDTIFKVIKFYSLKFHRVMKGTVKSQSLLHGFEAPHDSKEEVLVESLRKMLSSDGLVLQKHTDYYTLIRYVFDKFQTMTRVVYLKCRRLCYNLATAYMTMHSDSILLHIQIFTNEGF